MSQEDYDLMCKGFILGFMCSFDGWNGQVFLEWQRDVMDSEIFRAKMDEMVMKAMLMELQHSNENAVLR